MTRYLAPWCGERRTYYYLWIRNNHTFSVDTFHKLATGNLDYVYKNTYENESPQNVKQNVNVLQTEADNLTILFDWTLQSIQEIFQNDRNKFALVENNELRNGTIACLCSVERTLLPTLAINFCHIVRKCESFPTGSRWWSKNRKARYYQAERVSSSWMIRSSSSIAFCVEKFIDPKWVGLFITKLPCQGSYYLIRTHCDNFSVKEFNEVVGKIPSIVFIPWCKMI